MQKEIVLGILAATLLSGCWPLAAKCGDGWYNDSMRNFQEEMGIAKRDDIKTVRDTNTDVTKAAIERCNQKCTVQAGDQSVALSSCCPYKDDLIFNQCSMTWDSVVLPIEDKAFKEFCARTGEKLKKECQEMRPGDDACTKKAEKIIQDCGSGTCAVQFSDDWITRGQADFRMFMPVCDAFTYDIEKKTMTMPAGQKEGPVFVFVHQEREEK